LAVEKVIGLLVGCIGRRVGRRLCGYRRTQNLLVEICDGSGPLSVESVKDRRFIGKVAYPGGSVMTAIGVTGSPGTSKIVRIDDAAAWFQRDKRLVRVVSSFATVTTLSE